MQLILQVWGCATKTQKEKKIKEKRKEKTPVSVLELQRELALRIAIEKPYNVAKKEAEAAADMATTCSELNAETPTITSITKLTSDHGNNTSSHYFEHFIELF